MKTIIILFTTQYNYQPLKIIKEKILPKNNNKNKGKDYDIYIVYNPKLQG